MENNKADPEVAVTTPGSKSQNNNKFSIPDYNAIDKAVQEYLYRYKIDLNHEELVVSTLLKGRWKDSKYHPEFFQKLKERTGDDINSHPNIYVSTGTFKKGFIITESGITKGRAGNNLNRALNKTLDADSILYLAHKEGVSLRNKDKMDELLQNLHDMSDEELDKLLGDFLDLIKSILAKAKIQYSEIRRSGFGFYILLDIDPQDQKRIEKIRTLHKELVAFLNQLAGFELFDKQCTDAGTRVIRVENSLNLKNPKKPRLVKVIERNEGTDFKLDEINKIIDGIKSTVKENTNKTNQDKFSPESVAKIVKPYYSVSRRQHVIMDLVGYLIKDGISEKDIMATIRILVTETNDEESTKRFKTAKDTVKKFRRGRKIKGKSGLAKYMTQEDLQKLKECVGRDTPDINIPYVFYDGCTYMEKFNRGETIRILLGNFQAEILEEITYDDGAEKKKFYEITGTDHVGNKLPTLTVPAEKFNHLSWISEWGSVVIIEPGYSYKDHLRCAIQKHSNNIEYRTIYGHTGWRCIDGEWYYLHHGGAICEDGNIEDIEVDLSNKLNSSTNNRFDSYRFDKCLSGESLKNSIRSVFSVLQLAPYTVTYPILSAVFTSVLNQIISTDISFFIVGRTGCQKTELCAIVQSFFGKGFNASTLPANWSSTANSLEKQAYLIKDAVLVVDDFAPSGTRYDVDSLHKSAERLFRGVGNRSGRGRMKADGGFQITYFSRGLIFSSGEDIPRGQSLRSRILIVELSTGDVDLEKLTVAQQQASNGVFADSMASFLQWLAPRLDDLKERVKSRHKYYRNYFRNLQIVHDRTPDNFAILAVGLEYFLQYAYDVGAISEADVGDYTKNFLDVCGELLRSQEQHLSTEDPVLTGHAYISNINNGKQPEHNSNSYGWIQDGSGMYTSWKPRGELIGYVDEKNGDMYLLSESTYSVIRGFCSQQGNNLGTSAPTLWKRLWERRLLASIDQNQSAIRKTILGNRIRVLHFKISALLSLSSPPSPDSPQSDRSEPINGNNEFQLPALEDDFQWRSKFIKK